MTAKRKTTAKPAPETDAPEKPVVEPGILANDHDVNKLAEDVEKLARGLAERGVVINMANVDLNNLRARVEATAACRMLVAKGIATPAEMAAMSNQVMRELLVMVLQAVEEMRLRQQGTQTQQIVRGQDGIIKPAGAGRLAVVKR